MKSKLLVNMVAGVITIMGATAFPVAATAEASGNRYCGSDGFVRNEEVINYSRKETVSYDIKSEVPNYGNQIDDANCANVAGTVLIGYYDRMCENLIPDWKAYVQIGSVIKYKLNSFETEDVMNELHDSMGTGVGGAGTTFNGFHNGMRSYVENRGYTYETEDVGNLNFTKYVAALESDKPVAVFLDHYSLLIGTTGGEASETVISDYSSVAHVVVAYGYKIDTYYNANNQVIATRTYLKVASGLITYGLRYLCLDGKSEIDRATSILIK